MSPGHRSHSTVSQDRQNLMKKRKAVTMWVMEGGRGTGRVAGRLIMILCRLVMVVIIFSVCWLPYHLYFLASMSHPTINKYTSTASSYLL